MIIHEIVITVHSSACSCNNVFLFFSAYGGVHLRSRIITWRITRMFWMSSCCRRSKVMINIYVNVVTNVILILLAIVTLFLYVWYWCVWALVKIELELGRRTYFECFWSHCSVIAIFVISFQRMIITWSSRSLRWIHKSFMRKLDFMTE